MTVKKVVLYVSAAAIIVGIVSLAVPTPAQAVPRPKCTVEPGDPGCPPCTIWSSHLCRCAKIPACKI